MKMSKILLTALAMMTVTASAMAAPTTGVEAEAYNAMSRWETMALQGDTVNPVIEADRFYIKHNMHVTYYDEVAVPSELEGKGFVNVGVPMMVEEMRTEPASARKMGRSFPER